MEREVVGQLVWEEKIRRYPAVAQAAHALRHEPVWPVEPGGAPVSPDALYTELADLARATSFFAPTTVNAALDALLVAAVDVVSQIHAIRQTTQPAHHGRIDQRHRPDYRIDERHRSAYTTAAAALDAAIAGYIRATRTDLVIADDFTPIQAN